MSQVCGVSVPRLHTDDDTAERCTSPASWRMGALVNLCQHNACPTNSSKHRDRTAVLRRSVMETRQRFQSHTWSDDPAELRHVANAFTQAYPAAMTTTLKVHSADCQGCHVARAVP